MLVSSRVLVHTALAIGIGLAIPVPAVALAAPDVPKLCSEQQERDADKAKDTDAIAECGRLRFRSASLRQKSAPVPEDPEKITPYVLKKDIGVSPQTRKSMFGEGYENAVASKPSGYEKAAIHAAYYTGFYSARMGGSVYFVPTGTDEQLKSFMVKKSGGGDNQTHDDKNSPEAVLATKTTALAAVARAKILAGSSADTDPGPDVAELPYSDDMDADAAKGGTNTPVGDNVENRIKANEAEAAAIQAARDDGWFE